MNNIIIVGDSFCSSKEAWPQMLADLVNMELTCFGQGGSAWWTVRDYLQKQPNQAKHSNVIVFVHTNADRMPTLNQSLTGFDYSAEPTNELETAVKLYYKYIHNCEFMQWAQQAWFKEINQVYANNRVIHLHSFPWSVSLVDSGINVITPLAALSLNELGKTNFDLFNDSRPNHFSLANNQALAVELAELINNYCAGNVVLDHTKFEQQVLHWLDWK